MSFDVASFLIGLAVLPALALVVTCILWTIGLLIPDMGQRACLICKFDTGPLKAPQPPIVRWAKWQRHRFLIATTPSHRAAVRAWRERRARTGVTP